MFGYGDVGLDALSFSVVSSCVHCRIAVVAALAVVSGSGICWNGLAGCFSRVATALLGLTVDTCTYVRLRWFFFPVNPAVTCPVLVLPEVYRIMDCSGRSLEECFRILHSLGRQLILVWRQFTRLLEEFHALLVVGPGR